MDDLIARIRAAIDEDERMAEAAFGQARHGEWEYRPGSDDGVYVAGGAIEIFRSDAYGYTRLGNAYGQHIARHDPARVLRTVQVYRDLLVGAEAALCATDEDPNDPVRASDAAHARHTLEDLADIYGIEVPSHG